MGWGGLIRILWEYHWIGLGRSKVVGLVGMAYDAGMELLRSLVLELAKVGVGWSCAKPTSSSVAPAPRRRARSGLILRTVQ